jgi:hypothetical protein
MPTVNHTVALPYQAHAPWPRADNQVDWVDRIQQLEDWLDLYIGTYTVEWQYTQSQHSGLACIAFRQERSKTLFLLAWS